MVADKIDMSLDDIISSSKRGRGGGRGRRGVGGGRGFSNTRGSRGGAIRRGGRGGSGGSRPTPYSRPRNVPDKWEHDMYDGAGGRTNSAIRSKSGGVARRSEGLSTGSHLQISNLDFGVTESDIKELFSEFGKLKKAMINYDASGRSHGTADVVFERKADALKAFNTYNGVPLDGRPMKIEVVTSSVAPTSIQGSGRSDTRSFRGNNQGSNRSFGNNNYRNSPRSRGGRGFGRGRGRGRGGRGRREVVSKDDLDKELDSYIESAS